MNKGVVNAVAACGTQRKLARALNISPGAVNHWLTGRSQVTAEMAVKIEVTTGVSRELIRPDLWGDK